MKRIVAALAVAVAGCATPGDVAGRKMTADDEQRLLRAADICTKAGLGQDCVSYVGLDELRATFGTRLTDDDYRDFGVGRITYRKWYAAYAEERGRRRANAEAVGGALQEWGRDQQRRAADDRAMHCTTYQNGSHGSLDCF